MMGEDGVGQIVKIATAGFAMITLSFVLALMQPSAFDLIRLAPDAADTLRPAQLADALVALRVVD
jgi:hypothetical protein